MKRLVLIGVLALSLFLITGLAYAEEKLAYVDLGQLFDGYEKTKEYDQILGDKQQTYEKDRQEKLDEVKKFQEKLGLLSEDERESQKSELEDKIAKLQEFDRSATQDLRKRRDEKVQEIFKDINEAIGVYVKKEGLTLIFDRRALVYENKSLDVTEQVLGTLNKK